MIYCDTSVLVSALLPDVFSGRAQAWLATRPASDLVVTPWVSLEVAGALALKRRRGDVTADQAARALAAWRDLGASQFRIEALAGADFNLAERAVSGADAVLRSGDALHVAAAIRLAAGLATFDRDQADAARRLGLPVVLSPDP